MERNGKATEEWRDVVGFDGAYEVSNLGRVKSVARLTTRTYKGDVREYRIPEKVLKQRKNVAGYYCVNLYRDNRQFTLMVHRLVAEAFIPNPDNLPCVNHKDETQDNNRADNLEWCTHQYNVNYGTARERQFESVDKIPVAMFFLDDELIRTFRSVNEAARFIGKPGAARNIISCCKKRDSRHFSMYGYKWSLIVDGVIQQPTPPKSAEEKAATSRRISMNHGRKRAVEQLAADGSVIATFQSIVEASKTTGIHQTSIKDAARGRRKTAGGYRWRYVQQ